MKQNTSSNKPFWLPHLKTYPLQYSMIVFCIVAAIFPSLALVILGSHGIQTINTEPKAVKWIDLIGEHASRWVRPLFRGSRFEDGIPVDFQMEWYAVALIVATSIVCLLSFIQEYLAEDMGEKIARDLRFSIANKFTAMQFREATKVDSGLLASMVGDDIREIRQGFTRLWASLIADSIRAFLFTFWLMLLDTQLFILFIAILLPAGVILRITGKTLKKLSRQGIDSQSELLGIILEKIRGWQTIQVHHAQDFEVQRFNKTNTDLFHTWRRAARAKALGTPLVEWLGIIAAAFVIVVALRRIAEDALSSNVLTQFLFTVAWLSNSVQSISNQAQGARRASASLQRIHDFLGGAFFVSNKPSMHWRGHETPQVRTVQASSLSLAVSETSRPLVEQISFLLKQGDLLAIYGQSGIGKSTLLRAILGLEKPRSGSLQINNKSMNEEIYENLSPTIAFLPQEPFIFEGTIFENVVYPLSTRETQKGDLEKVKKALEKARLQKAPSDQVSGLSGGEKQRLMFARAFYKEATFWIMDEATSALDEKNERAILTQLSQELKNKIVIAVSHRSMIKDFATVSLDLVQHSVKHS